MEFELVKIITFCEETNVTNETNEPERVETLWDGGLFSSKTSTTNPQTLEYYVHFYKNLFYKRSEKSKSVHRGEVGTWRMIGL